MPSACHESDIDRAMRVWLDGPTEGIAESEYCRLIVCLWKFCETCAESFAANFHDSEVEDLASDYLRLIKTERKHLPCPVPRYKRALTIHMHHVLLEELDPGRKELWQLLSEALWKLERQDRAKCLGGTRRGVRTDQRNNTPFTEWADVTVTNAHNGRPPPADVVAFSQNADSLPHFYPPGANRWRLSAPRVIAPEDAGKLAALLLACADGWIAMRELFAEFRKHVHLLETISEPESTHGEECQNTSLDQQAAKQLLQESKMGPRHAATDDAFWELVSKLAKNAWEVLRAEGLTAITCQYLLANVLLGRKVKLEELGPHSTMFDQKKKALEILRKVLIANDFLDPNSEISHWHDKLWAEVLHYLAHSVDFCNLNPEKPDSGTLVYESPERAISHDT